MNLPRAAFFERMNPKRTPKTEESETCVFCGSADVTDTISSLVALNAHTENQKVCGACLHSMQERQPIVWLRWLKRNDPAHWQQVVENHRLRATTLSNVIRRMRIE